MAEKTNRREFLRQSSAVVGTLMTASLSAAENEAESEEIGKPLSPWTEGNLDLHYIYTGVGENMFYVMPDGTSMVLDTGEWENGNNPEDQMPRLPNRTRTPSEWVARYISRVAPDKEKIDYMLLSHFHSDHGGLEQKGDRWTEGRGEEYALVGLANIGEYFAIGKAFDRKYPDYTLFPEEDQADDGMENFRKFTQWKMKNNELAMEKFDVGQKDQICLTKNRSAYPDFHIQNICANGVVWDRATGGLIDFYGNWPKNHRPENAESLGLLFEYGPFRYFTGGDVSGAVVDENGVDRQLEGAVGKAAGPVDLCKTNHHSYKDAMRAEFVKEVQAQVYVTNVWDYWHLQDNTMTVMADKSLYGGDRIVCATWAAPKRMEEYKDCPWQEIYKPAYGHIVVRGYDGGAKFKIYFVTAEDESMTVKKVLGPFRSRSAS